MARTAHNATLGALLALLAGLLACRAELRCAYCGMELSAATRTVVVDNGQRKVVCDPRCALTERRQSGRRIGLAQVTDFETGRAITPAAAHYVTGSDVAPDVMDARRRTWPSDTAELHWHRCLPSIVAFASRDAADRFQGRHGGSVTTLRELGF